MKSDMVATRCALVLALLSFPTLSLAAEKAAWIGTGTVSCADFGAAYRENPKTNENLFFSWAQGFMSGLNTDLLDHRETNLNELSMGTQKQLVRSYCSDHPHAAYFQAVFNLYNRMRGDQGLPSYYKIWHEPPKGR
ncbi:MAG TPA: hypothetical protein VGY99_27990 [Candidatus Binataceae bacterium]|nr:hypothetical protein [Candidatus Binataceae bacterium]